MKLHVFFLLFLSWGLSAQCAELGVVPPDQWPRFRGPDGTGKATTETLPASWTAETGRGKLIYREWGIPLLSYGMKKFT